MENTTSDTETSASRVFSLIEKYGFSIYELSELFGTSHRTIRGWITGTPIPKHHLARLEHIENTLSTVTGDIAQRRATVHAPKKGEGKSLFSLLKHESST